MAFLLGPDPRAHLLRSSLTFVVVPMLNPDGAFLGNYRCDAGGTDLNRMWGGDGNHQTYGSGFSSPHLLPTSGPSPQLFPALHATLRLIRSYLADPSFRIDLFIDVQAHSTSRQSFMFCNSSSASSCQQTGERGGRRAGEDAAAPSSGGTDAILRLPR